RADTLFGRNQCGADRQSRFGQQARFGPASSAKKHPVKEFFEFISKYVGAALPIYGGIIAWAYLTASARLGIVDLFACEISTLCRVGTIVDIGKRYVDQAGFARPDDHVKFGQRSAASGNFVAQENYFPVFASNSKELQPLEAM